MSNSLRFFSVHNKFGRSKSLLTFILFCQQNKWIRDNTFCMRSSILRNTIYNSNNYSVKLISFYDFKQGNTTRLNLFLFQTDHVQISADVRCACRNSSDPVVKRKLCTRIHGTFQGQSKNNNQIKLKILENKFMVYFLVISSKAFAN